MNKKLLLHIGYPKTGSTTLQEEIFVKLHEQKRINYLGRTTKSSHTRFGKSNFDGIDWVPQIRRNLILKEPLKDDDRILKEGILNVISDEDLSFHGFFHSVQFGEIIDHENFPQQLKEIIGNDIDVSLMITLRNQSDLIFSGFIQKYRFVRKALGEYSFSDFLNNSSKFLGREQIDHLSIFDFVQNMERWERVFNSKMQFLFFEDFVLDKTVFFSDLSKILGLKDFTYTDFDTTKKYRQKVDVKDFVDSGYWSPTMFNKFISSFIGRNRLSRFLDRRYHMRSSVYLNFEKKLLLKFREVKVPKITECEKENIRRIFYNSNELLAKKYGVDRVKLVKYGYL